MMIDCLIRLPWSLIECYSKLEIPLVGSPSEKIRTRALLARDVSAPISFCKIGIISYYLSILPHYEERAMGKNGNGKEKVVPEPIAEGVLVKLPELAKILGVSHPTIHNYVNYGYPTFIRG